MKWTKWKFCAGIDEAGRGPLAGPVAVGAVLISTKNKKCLKCVFEKIKGKDSKKLTVSEREKWFQVIHAEQTKGNLQYTVSLVGAKIIDKKGIMYAIQTALRRSLLKINAKPTQTQVLLDGGLRAPQQYIYQKTIIKGDESKLVISLASIVAKVIRDKKMCQYAIQYPKYDFNLHKGYGTARHRKKLQQHGISLLHRASFCRFL
ncbi:ribonuclease HII [Patescibacteria group bacterium]|nr:ribonuclease HII [Patescibacteria group bacterium]MBU1246849.1 ribonuclease HII [Patescibacteria group bacterium]MBU1519605.1 ribonuclease HII [Patescibacteria group bacterium]MBU1730055.1 ribonuclease HII [Patescibacteria group bacterium]MBU1956633.1 ribonuclease HII [Patescibacteria group bacterium]